MRQTLKKTYALFGPGRVGRNMAHYLRALGHDVTVLSRADAEERPGRCEHAIIACDIVLAAVPDDALEAWRARWAPVAGDRPLAHFSGAATLRGVNSYHPLYSFPDDILNFDDLRSIAFACAPGQAAFRDIFPQAENLTFTVAAEDRAYYHALAVISGNFSAFVWNETAKAFRTRFEMEGEKAGDNAKAPDMAAVLRAYFTSVVDRFAAAPENSMTGPVARRDRSSVKANLAALKTAQAESPQSTDLAKLYNAFLAAAWPDYEDDDKA